MPPSCPPARGSDLCSSCENPWLKTERCSDNKPGFEIHADWCGLCGQPLITYRIPKKMGSEASLTSAYDPRGLQPTIGCLHSNGTCSVQRDHGDRRDLAEHSCSSRGNQDRGSREGAFSCPHSLHFPHLPGMPSWVMGETRALLPKPSHGVQGFSTQESWWWGDFTLRS